MATDADVKSPPVRRLAYRVPEIAEMVPLSRREIYNEIKRGHLKAARFGRAVVVMADALDAWLAGGGR